MTQKADREQVRQQNRGVILQTLRRAGTMARIELGQATGLSPSTVTAITADLLSEGLIEEWSDTPADLPAPAHRGRPRTLLSLAPQAASVLAVKLSLGKADLILADYSGRHLAQAKISIDTLGTPAAEFGALLAETIRNFLNRNEPGYPRLAEIVVAAQGFIDTRVGTVVWSPAFKEPGVEIVAPLKRAFRVPCRISNDVNMIAEALHGSNPLHYGGSFAVVFMDFGVGMALYADGQLFTGETGSAAEFGHANHIPGGRLCQCGKRGCMEAYLGIYSILRAANGLPDDFDPWKLEVGPDTLPELVARAQAGDRKALDAFAEAGRALGYGLARVIALFDPRLVAITGTGMLAFGLLETAMYQALKEALVEDLRKTIPIEPHSSTEDLIGMGTISGALRRLDLASFATSRGPARRALGTDNRKSPVQV
ncbi:ROK family transcriptional regulator [Breoghania sp.]|uniref:ROK family transcriptional regulator n=1 Tax=Breoghania sp. TaxID=2065378 RepID=UPI002AA73A98|nr:ROK family transcriptional regulator [Breoghania sp.]